MIDPQRQTIESILNKQVQYKIPNYQRDFEWKRENAEEFWIDLKSGSFFLGTFIFDVSESNFITIVDGQQRLTTIFILLAAIKNQMMRIGEISFASEINKKIAFTDRRGKSKKTRFIPSEKIKEIFELTIANDKWDGENFSFRREINEHGTKSI